MYIVLPKIPKMKMWSSDKYHLAKDSESLARYLRTYERSSLISLQRARKDAKEKEIRYTSKAQGTKTKTQKHKNTKTQKHKNTKTK